MYALTLRKGRTARVLALSEDELQSILNQAYHKHDLAAELWSDDPNTRGDATTVQLDTREQARQWTAGDVVAGDLATYRRGHDGLWRGVKDSGEVITLLDPDVRDMDVLRCQAAEQ